MGAVMYEMVAGHHPPPAHERVQGADMESAFEKGRGKYSDRLLGLIDHCLSLRVEERPQSIKECLVFLEADRDQRFREIISDISWKMVNHFCNWAKPNEGLMQKNSSRSCLPFRQLICLGASERDCQTGVR